MRELDGIRIIGPNNGPFAQNPTSVSRELVTADDTNERWRLGEVTERPDEGVARHLHPSEPEALRAPTWLRRLHRVRGRRQRQ